MIIKNRILCVEDNEKGLKILSLLLKGNNFDTCTSGKEALSLMKKSVAENNPYTFAIIDIQLDDYYGLDLLKDMQTLYPEIYCIIYSGEIRAVDIERGARMNPRPVFLPKGDERLFNAKIKEIQQEMKRSA